MGRNNQLRRRMKAKTRAKNVRARQQSAGPANSGWPGGGRNPSFDELFDVLVGDIEEPPATAWPGRTTAVDVSEWVSIGVGAVEDGDEDTLEVVVEALTQGSATWQRLVEKSTTGMFREVLGHLWHKGWQPADLRRITTRSLPAAVRPLIVDVIADELSQYASATVDPIFHAQVAEMGGVCGWSASRGWLGSRKDRQGVDATTRSALRLLKLLMCLPELERLCSVPGKADPTSHRVDVNVDPRILSRVRALLSKAESTTFEAEAETFTAGAQSLMARHSIDMALVAASNTGTKSSPQGRRIGIDAPYEAQKVMLLQLVAEPNRCRTVWSKSLGFVTAVGFPSDLEAVETLFTSLLVQATAALNREGSRRNAWGGSRTRQFRTAFLSAYAQRIGERLAEVTTTETQSAAQDARRTHGEDLLPVLAAREAEVQEAVSSMFEELVPHAFNVGNDREGWSAGRAAADLASMHGSAAVSSSGPIRWH